MAQIEVKQISKAYQDKVIFKDFSLSIHKGEMVAIIGESGRGKTTLLNCLGQLDDVDTGEIVIEGERVTKRNRKKYFREVFGFLFQNFALVDNETVYQNLSFISKDKERITEYLAMFGLGEASLYKKVYQLSGGEQQRVSLIRVLLKEPKILFADEPTASLDEKNSLFVMDTLKELRDKGVTIIVVTHDKALLPHFDRVIDLGGY